MANPSAWNAGWNIGAQIAQERRAQKQGRANELWEDKRDQFKTNVANLAAKYPTLLGPKGEDTPESLKVKYALNQAELAKDEFESPPKGPGAIERLERLLYLTKTGKPQAPIAQAAASAAPAVAGAAPPATAPLQSGTVPQAPSPGSSTPRTMAVPNPKGLVEAGNIPIDNRPVVRNPDGTESTEYSVSFGDAKGREVLVPTVVNGRFLTPDGKKPQPGSPEEKAMFQAAWQRYLQTGQNLGKFDSAEDADAYAQALHNRGNGSQPPVASPAGTSGTPTIVPPKIEPGAASAPSAAQPGGTKKPTLTPRQLKQQAQASQRAQQESEQLLAGGALSPGQQATGTAQATEAGKLASVRADMEAFMSLRPDATAEEQQTYLNDLIQKYFGTTARGSWTTISGKINGQPITLRYDKNTNRTTYQTGETVSEEDLSNFVQDVKTTEVDRERAEYDTAVKSGYKGSFLQYKTEQAAKGRAAVPKPQTAQQQFTAIREKQIKGEPLTADDAAFLQAEQDWINLSITQPKEAGYQALAWSRIVQAEVPGQPGEMQYVPAGVAYKGQMRGPSSVSHLMTIYYTTGKGGQDLLRFNTATHHLQLMAKLADALNNGNIPLINQLSNEWATATGSAAPTNFNGIRDAVAGELSRLYTGVGATQQEIANIESGVSNVQSPEQLAGIISTDLATMQGKIQASAEQYMMGTEGQPAFPEDIVPPPPAAPVPTPAAPAATPGGLKQQAQPGNRAPARSKGTVSVAEAMKKPKYKNMTKDQVRQAITNAGYTPVE